MKNILFLSVMLFCLSSCYTHTYLVGNGPQTGIEVKEKNHYLIFGLAGISTSNPDQMAGGAENYSVKTSHTFVDGLLNALTGGIYTPTTTIVTK
tara:strand:+ start:136 stop:417 length:282 start_codon:yes stop_codon:yes gene_type:complete